MPRSAQFDSPENLLQVDLPFDKLTKELETSPRYVAGNNGFVDLGGRFRKRPAVRKADFASLQPPAGHAIERIWLYETIEIPEKVYIVASMKIIATGKYTIYWLRLGAGAPAWTQIAAVRNVRVSDYPHEVVIVNGQCYIKGFAIAAAETLGTVRFDGTNTTTYFWGALGPSSGVTATASGGWNASVNSTTVRYGWLNAYSFELASGHLTNRSPFVTPTGLGARSASDSQAFTNKTPAYTYTGDADTTNFPFIVWWRTTDGGGELVRLYRFANPGGGSQTFIDKFRIDPPSGNGDPSTDFQLDTQNFAPSLTSNSPPPSVAYPSVVGTATIGRTSQMSEFASRIFYGVGNVLVFSGFEEIINGVPFESFPSGLRGNSYRLRNLIRNTVSTAEANYIFTTKNILWLRGTDRASFQLRQLVSGVGAAEDQPKSAVAVKDAVCFLTNDNQIALVRGSEVEIISAPLGDELASVTPSTHDVQIVPYFFEGNAWIVVAKRDKSTPANGRLYVYDLNRQQWNVPWSIPVLAIASGRIRESDNKPELLIATYDGTTYAIGILLLTSAEDQYAAADAGFAWSGETNTFLVPAGNHVNQLRRAGMSAVLSFFKIEHTGSADPTVEYRINEISGALTAGPTAEDPPYHAAPTTYSELWYPVQQIARRVAMKFSRTADTTTQAIQTIEFLWQTTTPPST